MARFEITYVTQGHPIPRVVWRNAFQRLQEMPDMIAEREPLQDPPTNPAAASSRIGTAVFELVDRVAVPAAEQFSDAEVLTAK